MVVRGRLPADGDRPMKAVDELILLEILNALHWDLAVPRDRVTVTVHNGHATLSDSVEQAYSKTCAERDARETASVTGVTDTIVVRRHVCQILRAVEKSSWKSCYAGNKSPTGGEHRVTGRVAGTPKPTECGPCFFTDPFFRPR